MSYQDEHRYDDIIHLPHHVSDKRPHMELLDRAAQFAPFAALTGHGDAIKETARLTDERLELDESTKDMLDLSLRMLREHLSENPTVTVTFFEPDEWKQGGSYVTITDKIKKIDQYEHKLVLFGGTIVLIDEIIAIDHCLQNEPE